MPFLSEGSGREEEGWAGGVGVGGQELVFYFSQRVFTSYLLLRFHHRVNIKSDPSPAKQGL